MKIDERIAEIKAKVQELDSLIDDTLDNEPEAEAGSYGAMIQDVFKETSWLDVCIMKMN